MPTRRVQDHIVNSTGNFDHQGFPTVAMSPNLVTEPTIWQQAYVTRKDIGNRDISRHFFNNLKLESLNGHVNMKASELLVLAQITDRLAK